MGGDSADIGDGALIADELIEVILAQLERIGRVFVAVDGRSGAGKSTLAAAMVGLLLELHGIEAVVVEGDDFYSGGSAATWDGRTAVEKADRVMDWRRQREVLVQLRQHGTARWFPFDWEASDWDAEPPPLSSNASTCDAAEVVVLEGAYSARPELHDQLDLRVLLDTPADIRHRRLLRREGEEYRADWENRWSEAEDHYFSNVMTPDKFDLLLQT